MEKIPSYVITLEGSEKKYKVVDNDFLAIGIPVQLFPGVYGKNQSKEYIESVVHPYALYTIENGRKIDPEICTIGAVGCYLSHIKIWEHLLNSKDEAIHVLEDDAKPLSSVEEMNKYIEKVPEDWDVIYLGFAKPMVFHLRKDKEVAEGVYKINSHTFQTHSYIINRSGAKKLLSKAFPIIHHVDSYMSVMAINGGLNSYRPNKVMIEQRLDHASQVGLGKTSPSAAIRDILMVHITRVPCSVLILSILIGILSMLYVIVKKAGQLIR